MSYWQLFYHLVWSTKNRLPLLTPQVEPTVHNYLRAKAIGLEAIVFALNGTIDHVHMVVSIPPKLAVAKFVGQIKAVASVKINQISNAPEFYWQDEYGAFSFDAKRLPNYIAYVERQKEHHSNQNTIPVLERTDDVGVQLIKEGDNIYAVENMQWRKEMIELVS
jgi:REP element-mobilizing transposase RayT